MKTLKELEAIRNKTRGNVNQRTDRTTTRIVVGMATCGIAAGARPVLLSIMDEVKEKGLEDITVAQTGCIGICKLEPIIEVIKPGQEKVTYVKMTAEKAKRVIEEHIIGGKVVDEFTMHVIDGKVLNDYTVKND